MADTTTDNETEQKNVELTAINSENKEDDNEDGVKEESVESKDYYKLDDYELEYNVKGLKERFERLIDEYSEFDQDIYNVSEKELMDILGNLSIDSYGVLLWILCMDQLETERKKIVWDILTFLSMRMPTQIAMDLLIHYSTNMARYSPDDVSELGKALVHGSRFPLSTCLVLSGISFFHKYSVSFNFYKMLKKAFFAGAAEKDLTRDEQLRGLSKEYAVRATTILEEVENDYLAVIMLETPSFHGHKSPLDIALENDIIDFLACNKMSRISNAIWTLPNLMSVGAEHASAFALSDFGPADIHKALLEDSYSFYFSSMGYYTVEVMAYLIYLAQFTYLTHLRAEVAVEPTWIDYTFWLSNAGFVLGEVIELGYDGWREYFSKWQNWLDSIISLNFILIIVIRSAVTVLQEWPVFKEYVEDYINDNDNIISLVYSIVWALNVIILWLRLLHFMLLSRSIGPLITNIKNMLADIVSFGKMYVLILMGFVFGLYFLIGGGDRNVLFSTVEKSVVTLVKTTLGQLEWECVRDVELDGISTAATNGMTVAPSTAEQQLSYDACLCDYDGGCEYLAEADATRADMATLLLIIFSLLTLVVLFNLLTAMMATTYRLITERSDKEVLSRKTQIGVEYDRHNQVMPPPFNMLVVGIFIVYSLIDAILLFFFQKFISESWGTLKWKCSNCNCLNKYVKEDDDDDIYDFDGENGYSGPKEQDFHCQLCGKPHRKVKPKRRFWRNPRQFKKGDGRWKTFVIGIKELLDIDTKDENAKSPYTKSPRSNVNEDDEENKSDNSNEDVFHFEDERDLIQQQIHKKDWICGFCRNRIPAGQLGDVLTFKERLFADDVRVDEDDIEALQQIKPLLCPICYRSVSVRSRIIFIMELISYYIFLFILYPIVRICLIPIYFFQALYAFTGQNDVSDDAEDNMNNLDLYSHQNTNEVALKQREIEELLPSDAPTRALLNPQHKIWKVLRHFHRRRDRMLKLEDVRSGHVVAVQEKRERQQNEEKLQKQRGKIVAQLGVLINKYWSTRLEISEKHKEDAKKEKMKLQEDREMDVVNVEES